jgi:hypothetical protein
VVDARLREVEMTSEVDEVVKFEAWLMKPGIWEVV